MSKGLTGGTKSCALRWELCSLNSQSSSKGASSSSSPGSAKADCELWVALLAGTALNSKSMNLPPAQPRVQPQPKQSMASNAKAQRHNGNSRIIKPDLIFSAASDRTEHTTSSLLMSAEGLQKYELIISTRFLEGVST